MTNVFWFSSCFTLLSCLLATLTLSLALTTNHRKVYIVYLGAKLENESAAINQHRSMVRDAILDRLVQDPLIYSYKRSFNGFAAKLTEEESKTIAGQEGVVSVFPSVNYELLTTRSWDFIGFPQSAKRVPTIESDIIVGVLDSGLWPESESFNDEGLGPPPKKWKGTCATQNFTCNNKVIGARVYSDLSPRDVDGHGTHTASTVAGRTVQGASLYGIAEGEARGGVPSARIAVYKVCKSQGCSAVDILAGFDDAIADGVDLISVSLGYRVPTPWPEDPVSIGSFHAMANGILTSNSAGNWGPALETVTSTAPWLLTVAATSIDRKIISKLVLGNDTTLEGIAVNTFSLNGTKLPLITGGDAKAPGCEGSSSLCSIGCLDEKLVKGKILVCQSPANDEGAVAKSVGALGLIADNIEQPDDALQFALPATTLSDDGIRDVKSYIKKTKDPQASILKSESALDKAAPTVVSFSSRGPNSIFPTILKPDISAPGVDILAAWSPLGHLTNVKDDERSVKYNIVSGTSMACPHATAAAAYVKSFHPDWSPSAIKSALMTTAFQMNLAESWDPRNKEEEFAYGAGNINPVKAVNPGLVFNASKEDYIWLLCQRYSQEKVRLITGDNTTCPDFVKLLHFEFNYPAAVVAFPPGTQYSAEFHRTVTNVGNPNSNYTLSPDLPYTVGIDVNLSPRHLNFTALNQKIQIRVQIYVTYILPRTIWAYQAIWTNGEHDMRFPVVVYCPYDE